MLKSQRVENKGNAKASKTNLGSSFINVKRLEKMLKQGRKNEVGRYGKRIRKI